MDDLLASSEIGTGRSICIATLSRETVIEADAEHLGFGGYFVFEASDEPGKKGIVILGKAASFEAAMQLADIFTIHVAPSLS